MNRQTDQTRKFFLRQTQPIPNNSRTQVESESDRENTEGSIKPENEPQAEAESDVTNTNTYPNEVEYCNADLVDDNTFQAYTIKAGTDNADELIGTANKDLILGLDGDDWIMGQVEMI